MEQSYTQKVEQLQKRIVEETQLIEEYQSHIDDLEDEIDDYNNEYDYDEDPNGDDFDFTLIHNLRMEISDYEKRIMSSQSHIEQWEDEINTINFSNNPSIRTLIQKWETKLNDYHNFVDNVRRDEENGEYSHSNDFQNDLGKGYGMVQVTTQFLEDLKEMIEDSDGNTFPKFSSIEDAYDYYWDLSRNPYDMYETERSLIEGEREFVEKCGYDWEQWCDINKNINNN